MPTGLSRDYDDGVAQVHLGDAGFILSLMDAESVQCCVTSPPYWGLRDYGLGEGGIGLEPTLEEWVAKLVRVFQEVRRVLRPDGTLWLNVGDAYAHGLPGGGSVFDNGRSDGRKACAPRGRHKASTLAAGAKPKDLLMLPARLALALQADGWYLRSDIIWAKPNPMPESVTDRPTSSHEHIFLLTKSPRYYYDEQAIREASQTDPRENYPARAKVTGRGEQGYPGNHQDKSGGYPPRTRAKWNFGRDGEVGEMIMPGQSAAQHRPDHPPTRVPAGWAPPGSRNDKLGRYDPPLLTQGEADLAEVAPGSSARRIVGLNGRWDHHKEHPVTRNSRNVWSIATQPYPGLHFATFPVELARRCILAGTKEGDVVLDPFAGSGTTLAVAKRFNRDSVGIELNPKYLPLIINRLEGEMAQPALPLESSGVENCPT